MSDWFQQTSDSLNKLIYLNQWGLCMAAGPVYSGIAEATINKQSVIIFQIYNACGLSMD